MLHGPRALTLLAVLALPLAASAQQVPRDSLLVEKTIHSTPGASPDGAPSCTHTLIAQHAARPGATYDYVGDNVLVGEPLAHAEGVGFTSWQAEDVEGSCASSVAAFETVVEALGPWYAVADPAPSVAEWLAIHSGPRIRSSFSPKNRFDATRRADYELRRLQNPRTGRIPAGIRARELAVAARIPTREQVRGRVQPLLSETWSLRGPVNVGGRTRGLAIDQGYNGTTNRRILAGGISGGMFLSEDGGTSWRLTSSLAQFASVTALAQDPTNPSVWYHGTGELLGNSAAGGGGAAFGREGVFKSVDGGETWAQLPSTAEGAYTAFDSFFDVVWDLEVHPQSGAVLAATFGGIQRSTDGGASWQLVLGRQEQPFNVFTDLAIAADGSVYAALSRNGGGFSEFGVYRSTDQGATWAQIPHPDLTADPYRMVLGAAPSDPNTVYLFVQSNQRGTTPEDHQFFRYNAATTTWTNRSSALRNEPGFGGEFSTQGGYDMVVAVKPDNPDVVWIGGTNLYRSTNGGQAFEVVGGYDGDSPSGRYANQHPDQHSIAFFPNDPNAMVAGHDGGLSLTTNALQSPQAWTAINDGYLTSQFYAVAVDPQAGSPLISGGLQDNGSWLTESATGTAPWVETFSGDGGFTAFAPGGFPLYVSVQNGLVFRLTQTNRTMVTPTGMQNPLFITPYLLDPNDARVMYLAAGNVVWRNSNLDDIPEGGNDPTTVNWTALSASAVGAASSHRVTALAVSTVPANRLYFGTTDFQSQTVLTRVDNPAANAAGTVITPPGLTAGAYPSSIAVHPANGDEIIATFSNYGVESVWHSADGGATWASVEGNLSGADGPSVRWASIVPSSSGTAYLLATSTGVYSTRTLGGAGTTWIQEGASTIGNVVVNMLATRPSDGLVVAGTHGRGVYSATLAGAGGAAVADTDVQRLDMAAQPGQTATANVSLTNAGTAPLTFTAAVQEAATREAGRLAVEGRPPTWSVSGQASSDPEGGSFTVRTAAAAQALDDVLSLDDGNDTPDDFVGSGDPFTLFGVSNRFELTSGYQLEGLRFYMRTESSSSNSVSVQVRDQRDAVIASGTVGLPLSPPNGQWYDITLNTPIAFDAGDAFSLDVVFFGQIAFPAGIDVDALVPGKSSYLDASTGMWVNITNVSGYEQGAFLLRALGTAGGGGGANQPPVANGTIGGTPEVGQTVTFDGSASTDPDGTVVGYAWDFGDGATSSQAVASHVYSAPGTYTVTLTVTDDDGATGSVSAQLPVTGGGGGGNQPPTAVAQVSDGTPDVGDVVTFDGSASTDPDGTVVGYAWDFGDGASSTQAVATHTYTAAGTYTATLTVTDNDGATGQSSGTVTVSSTGPSRFTISPAQGTVPPGGSQTLTVTFDSDGLAEGTYGGTVSIGGNGGTLTLPVEVLINGSVATEEAVSEGGVRLAQNRPNPFLSETTIRYELGTAAQIEVQVFDVTGRRIRVLESAPRPAGAHEVRWDGRDAAGTRVASGLYMYRLQVTPASGRTERVQRTMILLN